MKLISLNIWGARIREPFLKFILDHNNIGIFCFQELYDNAKDQMSDEPRQPDLNIFTELKKFLPNHNAFFRPTIRNEYGIGMFVKKEIEVLEEGEVILKNVSNYVGSGGDHTRNMQWVKCSVENKNFVVMNVHGLWTGIDKKDNPDRLEQSERIKKFLDSTTCPKILTGDFNLLPNTQSIAMLESGMENLIKTYHVTSTRTSFYAKEEKYADFMFVSPEVKVSNFSVLPDEVSDHSPLLLDFNL